jgi:hypothetical protein
MDKRSFIKTQYIVGMLFSRTPRTTGKTVKTA